MGFCSALSFCFCFWHRVLMCSTGWPWMYGNPPSSASQVGNMPGRTYDIYILFYDPYPFFLLSSFPSFFSLKIHSLVHVCSTQWCHALWGAGACAWHVLLPFFSLSLPVFHLHPPPVSPFLRTTAGCMQSSPSLLAHFSWSPQLDEARLPA